MIIRKQDSTGDMVFGHSVLDFYSDQVEAVAQLVDTRLNLFLGEWFLDTSEGVDYFGGMERPFNQSGFDLMLRMVILQTPGVVQINSLVVALNRDTREITVDGEIDTEYGAAYINSTVTP